MEHDKKLHISEAARLIGVQPATIRVWANQGLLPCYKTPAGQRRFSLQDLQRITNELSTPKEKRKIIYARVSSRHQLDDLNRQIDFLRSKFPNYDLITDIGSGINFNRKGLHSILDAALNRAIQEVVVSHKDRLCRFGIELIDWVITRGGGKLTILEFEQTKSTEQELAEDLMSIVTVFNCRQMGKRRYKIKDAQDKDVSNSETESSSE